jgi:uncharacterized delta-60 repeat protein
MTLEIDPKGLYVIRLFVALTALGSTIAVADEQPATPDIQFELDRAVQFVSERGVGTWTWEPGPSIDVIRLGATNREASVDYALGGGTAIPGLDYTPKAGTLHFAPSETAQTIPLPILDDTFVDGDKTVQVRLLNPSAGAVLGRQSAADVHILDDDTGIEFEQLNIVASESTSAVTLSVRRYSDDLSPIQLNYVTTDGTATAGQDYVASSGVISFAADEITQQIRIPILEDALLERSEEFSVTLIDPLNRLVLGRQNAATVRILDDDGPVKPDRSFVPATGVSGFLAVQADGKIFAMLSNRVVRLDLGGSIDPGFIPIEATNLYGWAGVYGLAVQSDGKVLVAGGFEEINGVPRHGIARLAADGTLLPAFAVSPALLDSLIGGACILAVQADGRILLGGSLSIPGETESVNLTLARIFADGTPDTGFDARNAMLLYSGWHRAIASLLPQPDGKILVVSGLYPTTRGPFYHLFRLNSDGSLDVGFEAPEDSNDGILPVGLQPDGQLIGLKTFGNKAGLNKSLVRLGSDGSEDENFTWTLEDQGIGGAGSVQAAAVQSDGKILVVGERPSGDGSTWSGLFRLTRNGVRDPDYELELPPDWRVTTILPLSNGGVVLAGDFQFVNGQPHAAIVRIQVNAPAPEFKSISRSPDGRVRLGLATEPGKTYQLQASVDLVTWVVCRTLKGAGEMIHVEDTEAPNAPRRFYRAIEIRRHDPRTR